MTKIYLFFFFWKVFSPANGPAQENGTKCKKSVSPVFTSQQTSSNHIWYNHIYNNHISTSTEIFNFFWKISILPRATGVKGQEMVNNGLLHVTTNIYPAEHQIILIFCSLTFPIGLLMPDYHLPKKLFYLLQLKPFINDEKCFLFLS